MNPEHGHLVPSAESLLGLADSERIAAIQEERWITLAYPVFTHCRYIWGAAILPSKARRRLVR